MHLYTQLHTRYVIHDPDRHVCAAQSFARQRNIWHQRSIWSPAGGTLRCVPSDDPHEITRAATITIALSGTSILIALPGIYWFLRMRRRYRHDLIMLLIGSNLFRSFWHILFPIMEYFHSGLFPTESAFCQGSGFMLTFAGEQADMAVLLIAIHSALSVWGNHSTHQQGGLYPYRYYAYAFWFSVPVILASLAFANPDTIGYTNQGSVCYLPSRPYKYIALAWVPRYVIACVVLIVYIGIYVYATHKSHQYQREIMGLSRMQTYDRLGWIRRIMGWFGKGDPELQAIQRQNVMTAKEVRNFNRGLRLSRTDSELNSPYSGTGGRHMMDSSLVLDTSGEPASKHHPRLPGGGFDFPIYELQELATPPTQLGRRRSENKGSEDQRNSQENRNLSRPTFEDNDFNSEPTRTTTTTTTTTTDASTSAAVDFAQGVSGTTEELEAPQTHPQETSTHNRRTLPGTNIPIPIIRRPESIHSRRSSVADSIPESIASTTPSLMRSLSSSIISKTDTQNDVPKMLASSNIIAQHERMRRQLRYLFVYPLAYILLWIAPFVSHIIRNESDYYSNPSFVLGVFVILSISIQAGVDTIIFSWIERPWRHIPGSDGSFLGSFRCFQIRKNRRRGSVMDPHDVRERLARQLRDLKRPDQRSLESDLSRPRMASRRSSSSRPPGGERYWWEQFEDDDDDGEPTRRRSSARNRRVSRVNYAVDNDEEHRGRERRRRVSFPDEFGRDLERIVEPPRRGSFPEDNRSSRSRSSHASSKRKRSGQENDWHNEDKVTPVPQEGTPVKKAVKEEEKGDGDPGAFHDVSLDDEGNVEEGSNVEDEVLPPEPKIVEMDDNG